MSRSFRSLLRPTRRSAPFAAALLCAALLSGCPGSDTPSYYAGIAVSPTAVTTVEGGSNVAFGVALTSPPQTFVDLFVQVTGTEAYVCEFPPCYSSWAYLTFTPTDWNTPQVVQIDPRDDTLQDGDVAYQIVVGVDYTTDTIYQSVPDVTLAAISLDNDAGVSATPATGLAVTEDGGTATFSVVLQLAPTATVTVPVTVSDDTEATVSVSSLTFTTANWATPQMVTVTGVDDAVLDGTVSWTVTLGTPTSTDPRYTALAPRTVSGATSDNDAVSILVTPTSGLTVTEAGGTATFSVVLEDAPTGTVTVPITSSNTAEATVSVSSLTFSTTDWASPQPVTVTGVDDLLLDGTASWTVTVGTPTSTDWRFAALSPQTVSGVTSDDDAVDEGSTITPIDLTSFLPYDGQVASGSSYYFLTGLTPSSSTSLNLTGVDGDVSLYVYSDATFTTLLCSSANVGATAGEGCTFTVPGSGTVYIQVGAAAGTTGALFTIAQGPPPPIPETEPNGSIATANGPFSADVTISAGITSYDYDYYAISNTGTTSASVTIRTYTGSIGFCTGSGDTFLELYDSTSYRWAYSDDAFGLCSSITYTIPAGTTYYARVRSYSTSGTVPSYWLDVNFP